MGDNSIDTLISDIDVAYLDTLDPAPGEVTCVNNKTKVGRCNSKRVLTLKKP